MFNKAVALCFATCFYLCLLLAACTSDGADDQEPGDGDSDSIEEETDVDANESDSDNGAPVSRLHSAGTAIVDEAGNTVQLRGVNLGGWLFNETWITAVDYPLQTRAYAVGAAMGIETEIRRILIEIGPRKRSGYEPTAGEEEWLQSVIAAIGQSLGQETAQAFSAEIEKFRPGVYDDSDLPLRRKLEERFGIEARDNLLDIFQNAWIKESNIAWLAEQGFNLVRVPITYRTLVTNSDLETPASLEWNRRAFEKLDRLLGWCEKYRAYAIIDIQECPGGQNDYAGTSTLYQDEAMQALTVQLWEHLSERYKERDIVAAYSLLAEPMSAPSAAERDAIYDRLVKAIRAAGDDHLLVIHDGFRGMGTFPQPAEMGWDNVIYSTHLFDWSAQSAEDYDFLISLIYDPAFAKAEEKYGVPVYIGSFSIMKDEDWAYEATDRMIKWMNSHNWPWSFWTCKRIDDPIGLDLWDDSSSYGLIGRLNGSFERPDVFLDDLETLENKFRAYADLDMSPNLKLLQALTQSGDWKN